MKRFRKALSPNAEIAVRALQIAGERDYDALHSVCARDVVLEFPYWPEGSRSWTGLSELIRKFSVEKVFVRFGFDILAVFDAGDEIIIEATSEGIYPEAMAREPYRNHYLFLFVIREGRVAAWREFFNPLEVLKQGLGKPRQSATV